MMYHLKKKTIEINKNGRYFLKMAVIQYIADRVLFAVVIDCGTLWSFSCGTCVCMSISLKVAIQSIPMRNIGLT